MYADGDFEEENGGFVTGDFVREDGRRIWFDDLNKDHFCFYFEAN